MHPQVIGRPSRLDLLKAFIDYARSFPGVTFERGDSVANWYAQHEPPFVPAKIPVRPKDIP
jgi:peptidoglycan-N-acetylglucosamine deacetylase